MDIYPWTYAEPLCVLAHGVTAMRSYKNRLSVSEDLDSS